MQIRYDKYYSNQLGREIEYKSYGHAGKPMIVFPTSGGRFYEYEDFRMIESIAPLIEAGRLRVYTPDSVDSESWYNFKASSEDRAARHNQYDRFIIDEFVPHIRWETWWSGGMLTHGCSMGAFHALNFYLRHPNVFDGTLALSGLYDARFFVGDQFGYDVYINSPVDYLKDLSDPWYLEKYRSGKIVLCVGQGSFEEEAIRDTRIMADLFAQKGIPARVNFWGQDTAHDWPWWRKQAPYYLNQMV